MPYLFQFLYISFYSIIPKEKRFYFQILANISKYNHQSEDSNSSSLFSFSFISPYFYLFSTFTSFLSHPLFLSIFFIFLILFLLLFFSNLISSHLFFFLLFSSFFFFFVLRRSCVCCVRIMTA